MAELKRFIHTSSAAWKGVENKAAYNNSIVFIHDGDKGVSIYTQGATFDTELTAAEVEPMVKAYLEAGQNVTITEKDGKLVIAAPGTATITASSTELVQAKAVAAALTTPVSLVLTPSEDATVYTFSETFSTLNGDTTEAVTAVFKEGDYIDLTNDGGLKISVDKESLANDLNYGDGNVITVDNENRTINHNEVAETKKETGTAINPTEDAKTFDIKSYGFDKYGHISTETTTTVTLPDNAFKNDNTTYDLDATANETEGVDVNLKGNDNTTDTVTFVGGSNVEVSLKDGKVEISSSFENDNTTYTGEKAIVVAQPEEGQTEGKISLKIAEDEKFLSQDANGLKSTVEVKYNSATNYIYLEGANGSTTGFDASAFVKDSFVESVEYVDQDNTGKTGKFLKFVFVVVDQDEQKEFEKTTTTTYVDVTDLINTIYDVEGDTATYSVVEESTKEDGTVLFTVKNTLGTISRDNASNTITVSKDGIATVADIKTILETIDSDLDATVEGTHANEIAVVTGITQVDGKITAVDSSLAATKTYVDNAINALDVTESTIGTKNANDEGNTVTVIDQITYSETDGKVSISASTTTAATKAYVDSKAAAATTKVVKSTDAESVKYLDVTSAKETDGSTTYTVKVSGVDTAISTVVESLDSTITVTNATNQKLTTAHEGLIFDKIEQKDGKITDGTGSATIVKYVDQSQLTNYTRTGVKYIGITEEDTISQAFEKCESAWEWGTI